MVFFLMVAYLTLHTLIVSLDRAVRDCASGGVGELEWVPASAAPPIHCLQAALDLTPSRYIGEGEGTMSAGGLLVDAAWLLR